MSEESRYREITSEFFERNIHRVARGLIGRHLVREVEERIRRARIVEVEVYEGPNDPASHAASGEPTQRTQPMFGPPGLIYVYTIYGMYHCLNLRAPSEVGPGAILIRAAEPLEGQAAMAVDRGLVESPDEYDPSRVEDLLSGPGKLCQALAIRPRLSGVPIGEQLYLEAGEAVWQRRPSAIEETARIGLNRETCGDCVDWKWRYIDADSPWTSCRAG